MYLRFSFRSSAVSAITHLLQDSRAKDQPADGIRLLRQIEPPTEPVPLTPRSRASDRTFSDNPPRSLVGIFCGELSYPSNSCL